MKIERFEDIDAWREGRALAGMIYAVSNRQGFDRDFRLRDQIRGAAISVIANIAEGFDSGSDAEFIRFLGYARRSASELQSHPYIALDQDYITQAEFNEFYRQAVKVKKLINGFIRYLHSSQIQHQLTKDQRTKD